MDSVAAEVLANATTAASKQASRGSRPLLGKLVEVVGPITRFDSEQPSSAKSEAFFGTEADGNCGRAVEWLEEEGAGRYKIETFSGEAFLAPEGSLAEFEPPDAEEPGGFDVAWPYDVNAVQAFAQTVGERIEAKGYCVIQMFLGDRCCSDAATLARALPGFALLSEDVEGEYLGTDVDGKVAWLGMDLSGAVEADMKDAGRPNLRIYDLADQSDMRADGLDALLKCDRALTTLGALMWPLTPHFEDEHRRFVAWGRTNCMVRASFGADDVQEGMRVTRVSNDDLERHMTFSQQRKLCLVLPIDVSGGELTLQPDIDPDVVIPLVRNRMVVFRHDLMSYSCRPEGDHVILQSWVLDLPAEIKEREQDLRRIDGPPEPLNGRVNVMAIATRYPGLGYDMDSFWNMFVAGIDAQVEMPLCRWDLDTYYREEHTIGFSMAKHGAIMTQEEIECFDNEFFGIDVEDAEVMAPLQRVVLEVGYECLFNSGRRRETMKDWDCGVFVGDSGSDWDSLCHKTNENRLYGRSNAITCQRLSHIFGLTGPCTTAETACSSSLVALGIANMAMRKKEPDQITPNIATNLQHALVVGINTIIGPNSYISLSGPGMLSSRGRCFTFNDSADGYARGEGCGATLVQVCESSVDAMGRLAMLIGSAINQDGRSASMTAPHGPSQQEVIKASMREAGVSPNLITIAECHGTGTALGDPIEIGALRGVMRSDRQAPILKTSAKANIGHLEAAAGMAGLIKCIQMLRHSAGAPNQHLRALNPHLDVAGYPVYFETELMDYGANSGLTGVSSFGFGGTNARADVWGNAERGYRKCLSGTILKERRMVF